MGIPYYGQNKDGDSLEYLANGKLGNSVSQVDADKYINPSDLKGAITVVTVDTAATSGAKTIYIPSAVTCANQQVDVLWTVASDAQATVVEAQAGYMLGAVLAQNGTGTTIVQSDGTDTKITVNDNIEPGTRLSFYSNGTNWICSGTVLSADADPAFS
tara:strand:+ start:63 stop:536 length:474 start_codon:yes stop_codon:yes gene_type:complete